LLAVRGPGIIPAVRIEGASLLDVVPTVLYLLGQPIPGEMDGQVLRDVIAQDLLRRFPVCILTEREETSQLRGDYTDEEARIVGERLRGLGYVD